MKRFETVDDFLDAQTHWAGELRRLREILLSCGLEETVKWGGPCYTAGGQNVVGIGGFQSYFGLWFFQGALLDDPAGVLMNAQPGRTRALRQWRMTAAEEIDETTLRSYVEETVAKLAAGQVIRPRRRKTAELPQVLADALGADPEAGAAFARLTPGRQREYADYVGGAKREETRRRRLDRVLPMIVAGQGLNDRYRGG
ncbi:MAG: YdeI/OmpD-associated family protein [Thermoanaerobaculia bacterium]|nr:YdeI/OmpD-associated family protein [Thermoanaerobaculia bacterium]